MSSFFLLGTAALSFSGSPLQLCQATISLSTLSLGWPSCWCHSEYYLDIDADTPVSHTPKTHFFCWRPALICCPVIDVIYRLSFSAHNFIDLLYISTPNIRLCFNVSHNYTFDSFTRVPFPSKDSISTVPTPVITPPLDPSTLFTGISSVAQNVMKLQCELKTLSVTLVSNTPILDSADRSRGLTVTSCGSSHGAN